MRLSGTERTYSLTRRESFLRISSAWLVWAKMSSISPALMNSSTVFLAWAQRLSRYHAYAAPLTALSESRV